MKKIVTLLIAATLASGCATPPRQDAPLVREPAAPHTPLYAAVADGVRVVLHEERCALSAVVDLPRAATWEEAGKTSVGCWGGRPDIGLVQLYFPVDRSLPLAPMQAFSPVAGT